MGTRHTICVVADGEYRVAQYGQWDGYPTGQGEDIRNIILAPEFDVAKLRENVGKCFYLNADGVEMANRKLKEHGGFEEAGLSHLSRDTSAKILQIIHDADAPLGLVDELAFVGDSLMCEWAYVLDLDNEVLEIHEGFNMEPLTPEDRFFPQTKVFDHRNEQYHPCKLKAKIAFADLADFDMGSLMVSDDDDEAEETAEA